MTDTKAAEFPLFDALKAADMKNYQWFSELEPDQQRKFTAFMMLQWMATAKSHSARQLRRANFYANPGMLAPVFNGGEHSLLQWHMLCASGMGQTQFHQWVPELKRAIRHIDPEARVTVKDFQEYYGKVFKSAAAAEVRALSEAAHSDFIRRQRLSRRYPELSAVDLAQLAQLVTDQELDEYDRQAANQR